MQKFQKLIKEFKEVYQLNGLKEMPADVKQKCAKIISVMLHPDLLSRSFTMYKKTIEELDKNIEPKAIWGLYHLGMLKLIQATYDTMDGINSPELIDELRTDLLKQLELKIPEVSNSWHECTALESFDIQHFGAYRKTILSCMELDSTLKQNMINVCLHFFINNPLVNDKAKKIIDCLEQVFIIEEVEKVLYKQLAVNKLLKEAESNSDSERKTQLEKQSQIEKIAYFSRNLKRFEEPSLGSYYLKHSSKFEKASPEFAQEFNGELAQEMRTTVSLPAASFVETVLIFLSHLLDSLKSCCSFEQAEDQRFSPRMI